MFIDPILLSGPSILHHEIEHIVSAGALGWNMRSQGYRNAFQTLCAQYTNRSYALALSSGSSALHVALATMGLQRGDEVILPELASISIADCVIYTGATPVFCDVDPVTLCIDPSSVKAKLTPKTQGIIAVHMYGQPCQMDALEEIAQSHKLFLLEEATQGMGSLYKERPAGSFGTASIINFDEKQTVVAGQAGVLVTSNEAFFTRATKLANQGRSSYSPHVYDAVGFNYSLANTQAALGFAQMARINSLMEKKKEIRQWYQEFLGDVPGISLNPTPNDCTPSFLTTVLHINTQKGDAQKLLKQLHENRILAEPIYPPLSSMPLFDKANNPNAYKVALQSILLPSGHNRTQEEIRYIADTIKYFLDSPDATKTTARPTGWLRHKAEVLAFFKKSKTQGMHIPFTHNNTQYYLQTLSRKLIDDPQCIELLTQWKQAGMAAMLSYFTVTTKFMHEGMLQYLDVLKDHIFFLVTDGQTPFGQVALDSFDFQKQECVLDNLYIEDNAPKGLAAAACEALFYWAKNFLRIKKIYNHIVASNTKVRLLAAAQGFKEINRTSLYKEQVPDGFVYRPMHIPGHDKPDEHLLVCVKNLEDLPPIPQHLLSPKSTT